MVSRCAILLGGLLLSVLVAAVAATQFVAYQFAFSEDLGEPWLGVFYYPWNYLLWRSSLSDWPNIIAQAEQIALGASTLVFGMIMLIAGKKLRKRKDSGLYGSADWASKKDIKNNGLLSGRGVCIGGLHGKPLKHNGPEHVIAFAPTRSGKGVGLVIPTALSWPHSMVVHDPKGEVWALTSGYRREMGQLIYRFDPSPESPSCCFNPLEEVRMGTEYEVADTQNISLMIVDPDGKGLIDHWQKTAHSLITACIMHCILIKRQYGKSATLYDVVKLLSDPDKPIDRVLDDMMTMQHTPDGTHPLVAEEAATMKARDPKEGSSVLSTAISHLTLYRDPAVVQAISKSDFSIKDLMQQDKPVTLYLVVSPAHAQRLRPLVRLIISQIVLRLTEEMTFKDGRMVEGYKHRLLMLLDEFAGLKRIAPVEDSLAVAAGYGLKYYLIVQDLDQLKAAYGNHESITGNAGVRIAYAPNKLETARMISGMLGKQTLDRDSITRSRGSVSVSEQQIARDLLTPDEVMTLKSPDKNKEGEITKPGEMLIFIAGQKSIKGEQYLFFRDKELLRRSRLEPVPPPS